MIRLFENRAILFKLETTYGTDATPVPGTDALLSFEGSCRVEADKLDRVVDLPYFGADPFVLVGKRATIEFTFDLLGSVTPGEAAPCAPVLLACGHAETLEEDEDATYNPISANFPSATIYFFHAGIRYRITGARGTCAFTLNIKDWPKARATFTGLVSLADIADATPGSLTLTQFRTPPALETETATLTLGGVPLNGINLEFDQGGNVVIFEGTAAREVAITDRKPSGTLTAFAFDLSTFNPFTLANSHAAVPIVYTMDAGASRIMTLTINQAQLELAALENQDGAAIWSIPFTAPADAGGDEYDIVFE